MRDTKSVMATTPRFQALQPRIDRNRSAADARKTGQTGAEGTGVDIRAGLPPIYRDQGRDGRGGHGQGGSSHTQFAQPIKAPGPGLFPNVPTQPKDRSLFNSTSPASYYKPDVPAARLVPGALTEIFRDSWMKRYSPLGGGRSITFNTPAFTAKQPNIVHHPKYDIPEEWTSQMANGFTEARVNDVTDGRPMPHRMAVYNLGGRIRV